MQKFNVLKLVEQNSIVQRFVWISVGIITVFISMLFLPWQQTVHGTGTLMALDPTQRNYDIFATVDGFVEKFYVKENQFVKQGDKLFKMRDLDADLQGRLTIIREKSRQKYENETSKLKNLQESLQNQKKIFELGKNIYEKKVIQLNNSAKALQERLEALKNRSEIEYRNYKRSLSLFKEGIESQRELELKRSIYLQKQAEYKKNVADVKNIQEKLIITQKEKKKFIHESELKFNSVKNNILSAQNLANTFKQNIEKESTQLSRYTSRDVVAKSDGYIIRIYKNDQNHLLKRGEKVLLLSPIVTQKAIRLRVSDFNMPLIKVGLRNRIIFYGWPALHISGWPEITHGTYGGVIQSIERTSYDKGAFYAIIVEDPNDAPWPDNEHLRIGTQASIWVRLSTVSIWYELWRLMVAQPPKMVTPQKDYKQW